MDRMNSLSCQQVEGLCRRLFDASPDVWMVVDPDGVILAANARCPEVLGREPEALCGRRVQELMAGEGRAVFEKMLAGLRAGARMPETEALVQKGSGQAEPMALDVRAFEAEGPGRFTVRLRNVQDVKALEARIQALYAEWDLFLRHELRNPLAPILAFSQMLLEEYPEVRRSARVTKYLEAIWQGGKRLERLLDLAWEVQACEQGRVSVQCAEADVYETVRGAVADAAAEGERERVRVIFHEGAGDPPALLLCHDPEKLRRALANLVKNALEHDPGEVKVSVVDGPDAVSVRVHNGGAPIPPVRLKTIFEKFNSTKREQRCAGLGTTIAKLFAEAHGGRVEATSGEAEGTVFCITIPKSARAKVY